MLSGVPIQLMTCLIKHMFQIKQDLKIHVFNMIKGFLTVENVIQVKSGIMINVGVRLKAYMWKRLYLEFWYM